MIRIRSARLSFQGFRGSPERASAISQRALRQLSDATAPALPGEAPPRVRVTVRVARGASDAAIATRVAEAIGRHLDAARDGHPRKETRS